MKQPIDEESLHQYLKQHVPEIQVPVAVEQFGFGNSNPTYKLTDSRGHHFVLRKKPPGKLLTTAAHRIDREHRVIRALNGTDIPVPVVYCFCENENVIGTPFFIMEFLDGRIFQDAHIPGVSSWERTAMWKEAVQTLARLHLVNPIAVGLGSFGKTQGFYSRQNKTLEALDKSYSQVTDVESKEPVGKTPGMDEMLVYFGNEQRQPLDRACIIHGDYKIDNLVFHKTKPEVIGILDWEISTTGHPLSDLSNLILPWTVTQKSKTIKQYSHPAFNLISDTPGIPSKDQCLGWYHEVAGWNPAAEVGWSDAFAIFRTGVMLQGIAARYAIRQARGEESLMLGRERIPYACTALKMVREMKSAKEQESVPSHKAQNQSDERGLSRHLKL